MPGEEIIAGSDHDGPYDARSTFTRLDNETSPVGGTMWRSNLRSSNEAAASEM